MLRNLPRKDRYAFRRKDLSISLSNHTLYRFGQVALHDGNAASTLQDLHENELDHQGGSVRLDWTASSRFYSKSIRTHCRAVSGACNGWQILPPIMIDDGPMRYFSLAPGKRCAGILTSTCAITHYQRKIAPP